MKRVVSTASLTTNEVVAYAAAHADTGWTNPQTGRKATFHPEDVRAILEAARKVLEEGLT